MVCPKISNTYICIFFFNFESVLCTHINYQCMSTISKNGFNLELQLRNMSLGFFAKLTILNVVCCNFPMAVFSVDQSTKRLNFSNNNCFYNAYIYFG